MTINEAIRDGLRFVRLPEWDPRASLELPLLPDGAYGPWVTLRDFSGQTNIGADGLGETSALLTEFLHDSESRYEAWSPPEDR